VKFLIHGNTPTVKTGYGVQAAHLADKLTQAGHEVAVSSTYGQQYGLGSWTTPNGHSVKLYPNGIMTNSTDILIGHAEHFFEGDPHGGWIIPLTDVWVLGSLIEPLSKFQVAAWTPVDHIPAPVGVARFLTASGAIPVAMSRFGQQQLIQAGLDPVYVPLSVDTDVYRPTFTVDIAGTEVSSRQLFNLPDGAFVVGMVAMNKDPLDRKGFNEAFRAFGQFWQTHQNAVLFVHTDQHGVAGGYDLPTLAAHAAVPEHAIVFSDQYAYRLGLPANLLAAAYTAMDVLLAPSHGEGFCVPLIEAQACGTPVIASDFAAQTELVGNGWTVTGQLWWDQAQIASYIVPYIADITAKLADAYTVLETEADRYSAECVEFAAGYSVDHVWTEHWEPFIASLTHPELVEKPVMEQVDVIVPLMRPDRLERLVGSINDKRANVIVVHDITNPPHLQLMPLWKTVATGKELTTYAEKVNRAVEASEADWVLVVGDDVQFTDGWFDAAVEKTRWFDVVGTNDSEEGRVRNPEVAAGRHADHFFIRRSYIDDKGACLDGPGVAMPECYRHWFVDREVIELAKARGVYGHAYDSRVIHHHPGYDGNEEAREADPVYMLAVDNSDDDNRTWLKRAPLVAQHRITR
jgi:glycosyltransferase involved in cell wall biosynthesis